MSRAYGEPVNVQARDDGRPVRFVWRGRLYTVRAILEHWVIDRDWRQAPEGEPGRPELDFWRVEAAPGPRTATEVYELRREAATGAWTLRRGGGLAYAVPSTCSMYRAADRRTACLAPERSTGTHHPP